jgi:3-deoxy-7-phosphoheptulonate synthase
MSGRPRKQMKMDQSDFEVMPGEANQPPAEATAAWSPRSWRDRPIKQQPDYKDPEALEAAMAKLKSLPPLVLPGEVDKLRAQLAEVAAGKRFILQGGDCAERFQDCNAERLQTKLKVLLQMSLVLVWGTKIPLTRIGRIAGQYMKPRSKPTEVVEGRTVMAYKGDAINGHSLDDREHNPARLVEGYFHSASTLNYIRGLLASGFADLNSPKQWDLSFVQDRSAKEKYGKTVDDIATALQFMNACGATPEAMTSTEIFTSHEGLVLDFEEAMTRKASNGKYYNLGAHFVWIGDRTRQLDSAHIEYFRGIENPIGCKCGPTTVPEELIELIQTVNPANQPGRIVLISRFGATKVKAKLREIINAVQAAGLNVVWQCDPMHGNTFSTDTGTKTRSFEDIYSEILDTFDAHADCGTWLGGVHLELTGENVTECVGGSCGLTPDDLAENYESFCDPRLNWQQSIELAFKLVEVLKQRAEV